MATHYEGLVSQLGILGLQGKNWDLGITPYLNLGLQDSFGANLGLQPNSRLGLWDYTPCEIGILGLNPFEIGIWGLPDLP